MVKAQGGFFEIDIAENQIEGDRARRRSNRKNRVPIARSELSPRQRTRAQARDGEKRGEGRRRWTESRAYLIYLPDNTA